MRTGCGPGSCHHCGSSASGKELWGRHRAKEGGVGDVRDESTLVWRVSRRELQLQVGRLTYEAGVL